MHNFCDMNEADTKSDNILDTKVDVNLAGATVSLNNETTDSESENESEVQLPHSVIPSNTNLNVENSNDVVVGSITQFHGPVTIYQNRHNNQNEVGRTLSEFSGDNGKLPSFGNTDAHLVTTDVIPRKLHNAQETSSSRKRRILYCLTALTVMLLVSIMIGILLSRMLDNKVPEVFELHENKSTLTGSKHLVINRERWGGRQPLYIRPMKTPVKYVIIAHTAGAWCDTIPACSVQMQQIQTLHVSTLGSPDIGYNFLIGGDANIYVGRGWDAHNFFMNLDTIGICFIGNYIYDSLTAGMIDAAQQLLKYGIEHEKLDKDYMIYAHNQTFNTQSPGINIYNQIKFWPHFNAETLQDID